MLTDIFSTNDYKDILRPKTVKTQPLSRKYIKLRIKNLNISINM